MAIAFVFDIEALGRSSERSVRRPLWRPKSKVRLEGEFLQHFDKSSRGSVGGSHCPRGDVEDGASERAGGSCLAGSGVA